MEAFTGYDGSQYTLGSRVELHPGCDLWMQGARYGTVVGCHSTLQDRIVVQLDKLPKGKHSGPEDRFRAV